MNFDWETFTYDEAWLREAVRLEAAAGVDIELGSQPTLPGSIDPVQLQNQLMKVRLFPVFFGALRGVLNQADLGAGLAAALTRGRVLIQQRLQALSPEQVRSFEPLLTQQTDAASEFASPQLTLALYQLLTDSDWQAIVESVTIAIQTHLLEQVALHRSA